MPQPTSSASASTQTAESGTSSMQCIRSLPRRTVRPLTGSERITQRLLPSSDTEGAEMHEVEMQNADTSTTTPAINGRKPSSRPIISRI